MLISLGWGTTSYVLRVPHKNLRIYRNICVYTQYMRLNALYMRLYAYYMRLYAFIRVLCAFIRVSMFILGFWTCICGFWAYILRFWTYILRFWTYCGFYKFPVTNSVPAGAFFRTKNCTFCGFEDLLWILQVSRD